MSPRFSPDGGSLTAHIGNETGSDVWIIDLARGSRTRVTSRVNSVMPFFNPDGTTISEHVTMVFDFFSVLREATRSR